ncbi:uncharacterized protein G2W53_013480 [Senna tora]|uniref:Uncharacterized protein n=1 Tax=Senna tora TaxID=362788 RepID=A0A834U0Q3_9FABA|nr:uncharacterized protein G2W53_013480 [Senna tora]
MGSWDSGSAVTVTVTAFYVRN